MLLGILQCTGWPHKTETDPTLKVSSEVEKLPRGSVYASCSSLNTPGSGPDWWYIVDGQLNVSWWTVLASPLLSLGFDLTQGCFALWAPYGLA